MNTRIAFASAVLLVVAGPARAQFGNLLNRAERTAADVAERAARDAAKPKPAEPAKAAPGQPAKATQTAGPQAASGDAAAPPEAYGNRYDFIPGDKVLVFDDFSDTDVGEYPAKWTVKDGGGNQIEVVQVGDRRFVKSRYLEQNQPSSTHWLRYEIKGDMPKNFTIEFDTDIAGDFAVLFSARRGFGGQSIEWQARQEGRVRSANATGRLPVKTGIQHVAIAVSGTQVKLYVGGERVLSDPDGVVRPVKRIGIGFDQPYRESGNHQMFTAFRLAEGGKPAKQMLAGEGRIVTHGILFDTSSDVIKPESGPTLRSVLALLNEDAALQFAIEGHTDDQGGPKVNGPLSERRAEAVRAWLVKQGIDGNRLSAKGLGQSKPIDTNDTAEGRANNRRVEFVRTSA
jgi:outer membrane protein OmpA-like peptidoglycan-associated protein